MAIPLALVIRQHDSARAPPLSLPVLVAASFLSIAQIDYVRVVDIVVW